MVLRIEDISFIGVYINDSFRDFKDIDDYANYHVSLLNNKRYNAFTGDFIDRVVKGGYATDPNYKKALSNVYNQIAKAQVGMKIPKLQNAGELGKDIPWVKARQRIGMVFQSYELFAHLSVIDNILLGPLKVQKRDRAEAEKQADELLKRVGLYDRKNAYPRELSGGQKQRIAIVRSLCMNPEIILFDEVTAALDPEMVREVLDVILGLAKDGMTMLIVTHEMNFARQVANRIVFMDKGQIIEQAKPEDFFTNPTTDRAKTFLNILNYEPRGTNYEENI